MSSHEGHQGPVPRLSSPIKAFIDHLICFGRDIESIWLLGSRANGTSREDSDWDFLIFGDDEVLEAIRTDISHRRANIHLFVVTDGNHFESLWPHGTDTECIRGCLHGSLDDSTGDWSSGWCWEKVTATEAHYTTPREPDAGRRQRAFRVFPE